MASSLATESQVVTDNNIELHEDFEGLDVEVLEINSVILSSLLQDSLGDGREHDRLDDVIRSLEAELDESTTCSHDWGAHTQVIGHWSDSTSDDFSWIDMDTVPSSPGEGMNWYMEEFGDEMNYAAEFGCVEYRYCYPQVYSMEEATTYDGSLWHETCDEMMQ